MKSGTDSSSHSGSLDVPKPAPESLIVTVNERFNKVPHLLLDIKRALDKSIGEEETKQLLADLQQQYDKLFRELTEEQNNPALSYSRLSEFVMRKENIEGRLEKLQKQISANLANLAMQEKTWKEQAARLNEWRTVAADNPELQRIFADRKYLFDDMDDAFTRLTRKISEIAALSANINVLQTKLYSLELELNTLVQIKKGGEIAQTAPSILSLHYYHLLSKEMKQLNGEEIFSRVWGLVRQAAGRYRENLLVVLLVFVLTIAIWKSSRTQKSSVTWRAFSTRPFATAVFLVLSCLMLQRLLTSSLTLSAESGGFLFIGILLSMARLGEVITGGWLYRHLLLPMIFVLILALIIKIFNLPIMLIHLIIFLVSLCGVLLFGKNLISDKTRLNWGNRWLLQIITVFFIIIISAEIIGYSQTALYLFSATLDSMLLGLVCRLLYLISRGLLELLLQWIPLKVFQRNSGILVREASPFLAIFYGVFFLLVSLVAWRVFPTVQEGMEYLADMGLTIGSYRITPSHLLVVFLGLYLIFSLSRAVQAILLQEVMPRYGMDIGVQFSINRLIHYAILVIGFLILLQALGVEMDKLAILGGALGVGIGFGLQAIVNNFASGIILLFERPLKVGDMIQLGDNIGEVKKLGLRATIVRTLDSADIVIPNSELITGQVTNWTLADRRVRVKIPVGVAYGSDIQQVMDILLECAENNPRVLSQPQPQAFFLSFGSSSLDFELRVWVTDFADRRPVLSELNQEIESELADRGIEIPFPQRDLHLRSVDADLLKAVRD